MRTIGSGANPASFLRCNSFTCPPTRSISTSGECGTLFWLDDLGAIPLPEHPADEEGFLFSYARHIDDYRQLVAPLPLVRDRPEEREPLLVLDKTLDRLGNAGVEVPMPKTWRISVDDQLPKDLSFPLFLRTVESSWKVGGEVSRVRTEKQFHEEAEQLRRAFGWNVPIMAREWLNLATAGESVYGRVPQEIRTWSVDGRAVAWSFHHLHAVPHPKGFPPTRGNLEHLGQACKHGGVGVFIAIGRGRFRPACDRRVGLSGGRTR